MKPFAIIGGGGSGVTFLAIDLLDPAGSESIQIDVIEKKAAGGAKHLHALGTALKGILWESTAIPEIRVQVQCQAQMLLRT